MTGNLSFGDNDKAIFGAGSDLQIYHDGATGGSYITELGSSSLFIQGANVVIEDPDGNNMIRAADGGEAQLYYNGSQKLATTSTGVDITGTLTSDGLTLNGDDDITYTLSASGSGTIGRQDRVYIQFNRADFDGSMNFFTTTNGSLGISERLRIADNGDISFYEDTGTTAKFFWDASAESLGIGTSSPTNPITISSNGGSVAPIRLIDSQASGRNWYINNGFPSVGYFALYDGTAAATRMVIDTSGNVGIGTSSPIEELDIVATKAGDFTGLRVHNADNTLASSNARLRLTTSTNEAWIASYVGSGGAGYLTFGNENAERMRIDSNGALIVGATTGSGQYNGTGSNGMAVNNAGQAGQYVTIQNETDSNIYLTKKSGWTDNRFIQFSTNATSQAQITYDSSLGVLFKTGTNYRTSFGPAGFWDDATSGNNIGVRVGGGHMFLSDGTGDITDNARDIGRYDRRVKDLYLGGGVYLGGTGSANLLDDYEEGTFTPVIYGTTTSGTGTYTLQLGSYIKIGNLVNVQIYLGWSAHTGTGNMRMSGLPFNAANHTSYGYSTPTVSYVNGLTFTRTQVGGYLAGNSDILSFNQFDSGILSGIPMDSAVSEIMINATYRSV
jgi:hypothetical protein